MDLFLDRARIRGLALETSSSSPSRRVFGRAFGVEINPIVHELFVDANEQKIVFFWKFSSTLQLPFIIPVMRGRDLIFRRIEPLDDFSSCPCEEISKSSSVRDPSKHFSKKSFADKLVETPTRCR